MDVPAPLDGTRLLEAVPPSVADAVKLERVNIACAGRVLSDKTALCAQDGEEVALLPPVSGGSFDARCAPAGRRALARAAARRFGPCVPRCRRDRQLDRQGARQRGESARIAALRTTNVARDGGAGRSRNATLRTRRCGSVASHRPYPCGRADRAGRCRLAPSPPVDRGSRFPDGSPERAQHGSGSAKSARTAGHWIEPRAADHTDLARWRKILLGLMSSTHSAAHRS